MKYLIYDLETTGLMRTDEAIQFGGLLTDENLRVLKGYNFYGYTQVPISEKAQKTHGISQSLLMELSKGRTFEDGFYEASFNQEKDLTWVSFSTNGFDERLVNQTLKNNGLPAYDFGSKVNYFGAASTGIHHLDAYRCLKSRVFHGRDQRLGQIVTTLPYSEDNIQDAFNRCCSGLAVNTKLHDALYDSFCLWLVLSHYKSRLGVNGL